MTRPAPPLAPEGAPRPPAPTVTEMLEPGVTVTVFMENPAPEPPEPCPPPPPPPGKPPLPP